MTFSDDLAGICDESALLFLAGRRLAAADSEPTPRWELERQFWLTTLGSDAPAAWINEITSAYMAEAAHQVRAIGLLLRAELVAASLDPLVRAVIERAGRVKWILDATIEPPARAARAAIEFGVSLQHYREALARLDADPKIRKEWRKVNSALRDDVSSWFEVERPPDDACDPDSPPTKDMARWIVGGQKLPTFTAIAQISLATDGTTRGQAAGTYDGITGFSHPSVIFAREHRRVDAEQRVTLVYEPSDLEKAARFAAFSFLDAGRYWTTYYEADRELFQRENDELGARMDSISVLGAPPAAGNTS